MTAVHPLDPRVRTPIHDVTALPADVVAAVRRRAIFDCCKWDPQVEDVCTIADVPLVLDPLAWDELVRGAEALAREVMAAETELATRPDLHTRLGLPRAVIRALRQNAPPASGGVRFVRFDFHLSAAGWRISEANTDVPGGLNEASGLPRLLAPYFPGTRAAGDVAGLYADALLAAAPAGARVALVHATAYTDDRQVLTYLAAALRARGADPVLVSPAHLRWREGRAAMEIDARSGPADAIVRFFPAEWMPDLPSACGWPTFFTSTRTPISNPATAILTQTKRFPLLWDALRTPLATWRALLPETRDPRDVDWQRSDEWVLKPALGRVGEDIGIRGVTPPKDWDRITRNVRRHAGHWVAQQRFAATPVTIGGRQRYPSVGVYTVNGHVAGAYGRIASRPLIDAKACDAAVLVEES